MQFKALVIPSLMTALLAGCAHYKIQPIAANEAEAWAKTGQPSDGFIFYQPELYFSVTTTVEKDKTSLTVSPLFLPNYKKPYRLTTFNFLAKADFAFEFENGWKLTKLADKSDNSTVANTLAGELKTILSAAGMSVAKAGSSQPQSYLYHANFDEQGIFNGFTAVKMPVSVPDVLDK